MKIKNLYLPLTIFSLSLLVACNKEADPGTDDEVETTFKLSENQAVSESIADDANVVFFEAAASEDYQAFVPHRLLNQPTLSVVPR